MKKDEYMQTSTGYKILGDWLINKMCYLENFNEHYDIIVIF